MRVVVLGCSDLAVEVCNRLLSLPGVTDISLVRTPYVTRKRSFTQKITHIYRTQGLVALAVNALKKLQPFSPKKAPNIARGAELDSRVRDFHFGNFHDPLCIDQLRSLRPDLGVIAGTYILKESVFSIPKHGCINLHSGRVPEYRGAAPGFWEMYNGELSVGITIHRVVSGVDAGNILLQEEFPFDRVPEEDPAVYIERYRSETLRPNGIRMLTEAVSQLANGAAPERTQDIRSARTYRTPTYKDVREMRRRVAERRKEARPR